MSYAVDWTPAARRQLAAHWVQHRAHRWAITAAQARIDRRLAANPAGAGTPLSEGLYSLVDLPLGVLFEIDDGRREVTVVSVGWSP
jgi:hypothetical protein